jgi:hypothetical protein
MKNGWKNKNNFTDALAMDVRYAVLTKTGRIQILVKPRPKQLRKRGKRGWHLFSTVENTPEAGQLLTEAITRALAEAERPAEPGDGKEAKGKAAKTKAATAAE